MINFLSLFNQTSGDNKVIIFLHIPRTGGSSLEAYISRNYSNNQILSGGVLKKLDFNGMNERKIIKIVRGVLKRLDFKGMNERKIIKIAIGHIHYGIHQCFSQPSTYITFLRNPVDRIISLFFYAKKNNQHKFHRKIIEEKLHLKDFLLAFPLSRQLFNSQLQHVTGVSSPSEKTLIQAKEIIDQKFLFVGLTERYNEGIRRIHDLLGWGPPREIYHRNRASSNLSSVEYHQAYEIIAKHNFLDLELYNYVKNRYHENISSKMI